MTQISDRAKAATKQLPSLYRKFDAGMQEDENLLAVICGLELLRPIAAGTSVIAPVEPTDEIVKSGFDLWCIFSGPSNHFVRQLYKNMITAVQEKE